jgi:putative membrane protein
MNRSLGIALFAAVASIAVPAAAKPAAAFLGDVAQIDNAEIGVGNLAAQRGASPTAREFGRRLASDHTGHLSKVRALAGRMHVRLPDGVMPADRATAHRLEGLHGRAFDHEFGIAMADGHRKAIAMFEAQARTGDRDTVTLARATLPTLHEHLRMAESLSH